MSACAHVSASPCVDGCTQTRSTVRDDKDKVTWPDGWKTASTVSDPCAWANNGMCDVPAYCDIGDFSDCASQLGCKLHAGARTNTRTYTHHSQHARPSDTRPVDLSPLLPCRLLREGRVPSFAASAANRPYSRVCLCTRVRIRVCACAASPTTVQTCERDAACFNAEYPCRSAPPPAHVSAA